MRYLVAIISALALVCPARAEFIYEYTRFLEDGKEWWYQGVYKDAEKEVKPFVCGFVLEEFPGQEEGITAMYCNVVNERYENVFGQPIAILYEDVEAHKVSVVPLIKEVFENYGEVDMYDNPQVRFVAVYCNFGYAAKGIPVDNSITHPYDPEAYLCTLYDFNIPVHYTGPNKEYVSLTDWTIVDSGTMLLKLFTHIDEVFPVLFPSFIEGMGCLFDELGVFLYPTQSLINEESCNILQSALMAVRNNDGQIIYCMKDPVFLPWENRSGISRIRERAEDNETYDFSGRRIGVPFRGQIYIRGGHKFIGR